MTKINVGAKNATEDFAFTAKSNAFAKNASAAAFVSMAKSIVGAENVAEARSVPTGKSKADAETAAEALSVHTTNEKVSAENATGAPSKIVAISHVVFGKKLHNTSVVIV